MGNCNFKNEKDKETVKAVVKGDFQFHYVIGKGGFGKVWKVESKSGKRLLAMKEMSKARILAKRSDKSVMNEMKLLVGLKHQSLINIWFAFQDMGNLYLIMDLLTGGDLRYHICRKRKFSEDQTKFFIACIVSGLEYIHNNSIIHRDIKPENLVLCRKGYLKITDFGIARIWNPTNHQDTSGTPGYMAPEVMCRHDHGVAVDYFAMGVIAYECMLGRRPYLGRSRKEIRDQILSRQVQIKRHEIPYGWSLNAADFINKLIQRKPSNRLGARGSSEVKSHPWLKDIDWTALINEELQPPFVPNKEEDNFDAKNSNNKWKDDEELMKEHTLSLREKTTQAKFDGYYFDVTLYGGVKDGSECEGKKRKEKYVCETPPCSQSRMASTMSTPHNPSINTPSISFIKP